MRRLVLMSVVFVGLLTAASAQAAKTQGLAWTPGPSFDYGTLDAADGGSASQTFTLKNTGGKPTGTLLISLTGSPAFAITADTCTGSKLSAKRSCSVTVKYAPSANGSDNATLTASGPSTTGASDTLSGASAWQNGDLTTYTQVDWSNGTLLDQANFTNLFKGDFEIGSQSGFYVLFDTAAALNQFFPQLGNVGPLTSTAFDPTSTDAGAFAGETAALKLNIAFADSGLVTANSGLKFGDITICGLTSDTDLNGQSVRGILGIDNTALSGATTTDSITDLYDITVNLNGSFAPSPDSWAQDHLVDGSCP